MRFIHTKSGEEVKFLKLGRVESSLDPVVVYETAHGEIWTRPAKEFFDGRFITIEAHVKSIEDAKEAKWKFITQPSKRRGK